MNKICTTIKQSKKLIELGLDVKTADMYYMYRHWEIDEETLGSQSDASIGFDSDFYYGTDNGKTYHYIPAWSLAALLELMPFHIIENNVRYEFQIVKGLNKEGGTYKIKYKGYTSLFETLMYNEPIDAAFEMVVWLKENGKV